MSLTLYPYRYYDAQSIIDKATPNISTMTINGSNVECVIDSIYSIKTALNSSYNDIYNLCNISNPWSNFGAFERTITGGVFYNTIKTPRSFSYFCGYNHDATTPGWLNNTAYPTTFTFNPAMGTKTVTYHANLGELDYTALTPTVTHLKFKLKDGTTTVASKLNNINDILEGIIDNVSVTVSSWSAADKTLTAYLYLSNSNGDELALLPNTTSWTVTAHYISSANSNLTSSAIYEVIGGSTINQSTGYFTIQNLVVSQWNEELQDWEIYLGFIRVVAKIYDDNNTFLANQTITTSSMLRDFTGTITTSLSFGYTVSFYVS
jgi:hypothetical protein